MEKFVLLAGSLVLIPSFQIPRFLFVLLKKDVKCWNSNFRRNWPTSRNRVTCEDGTNRAMVVKFYKTLSVIHMRDKATTF